MANGIQFDSAQFRLRLTFGPRGVYERVPAYDRSRYLFAKLTCGELHSMNAGACERRRTGGYQLRHLSPTSPRNRRKAGQNDRVAAGNAAVSQCFGMRAFR